MDSYWTRTLQSRLSRRRAITGTASLGAAAMALSALGCGSESDGGGSKGSGLVSKPVDTTKQAVKGGVMVRQLGSEPQNYDPIGGNATAQTHGIHVYSRLLRYKVGTVTALPDGSVEGDAMSSWELSPDGLQATLKLRPNMKLDARAPTNGRALTIEDVKWSWERFVAASPSRADLVNSLSADSPIASMTFPDSSTAVIKLAFPYGGILKLLAATYYYYVLPVEADGKFDVKQEMRGTGPWILNKHEPSAGWEYRRNPNWFNASERPFLDGVDYPLIAETAQIQAQFRAKRIWELIPSADLLVSTKKENPDVAMQATSPLTGNGSGMILGMSRLETSPFADVRVRHAMSMLIDRDGWLDTFFNVARLGKEGVPMEVGWHSHAYCSWPTIWLDPKTNKLGEGSKYFQHNPDEAAKLMRAAGKFGLEQDFAYHSERGVFGGDDYQKQMEVFAQMLQEGGHFKLKTVTGPYVTFIRPNYVWNKGQYEGITGFPHGARPDWDLMMASNYYPNGKTDMVGKPLPKIHDIQLAYRRELDEKKRIALAQDWQREMALYMPSVPFPGLATSFTLTWPWLGNAGVYHTWSQPAASAETLTQLWYDKSKDTRSS